MVDFILDHPVTALFAEVGLGKTAAALTALSDLLLAGEVKKVLIVAPKRVAETVWEKERDIWSPRLPMRVIAGTMRGRMGALSDPAPIHIVGRDNVVWLTEVFGKAWPYDCLVLDESQSFKDASSKRFKALKRIVHQHERTILLSATPASESLMGLWSQIYLADRGERLGKSFTAFKQAFFESDYMGWTWTLRKGAEKAIHERIEDVSVAMKVEDYLTLPKRIDNVIAIDLSESERRKYETLEKDYLLPVKNGEVITAANAAVLFGKLLQLAGGAVYHEDKSVEVIHGRKIDALEELIESANGSPVLVFYGYQHERDRIIKATKAEMLDVAKWNAGKQRVAVAHPASAGAGLNLQHGGNLMCWYSVPPSLELYTQACGRLHRQGQTRSVIIHHLIVSGTIDEDVMVMLRDKHATQERLLEALKRRIEC